MDNAIAIEGGPVGTLFTVKEVAEALRVAPATVYELVARGRMACHRVGGRGRGAIRVSPEQLRAYLASCETGPVENPPPFAKPTPRPGAFSHLPPS